MAHPCRAEHGGRVIAAEVWFDIATPEIDRIFARIRNAGAEHGLVLRTDSVYPVSTMDAHRDVLRELATDAGLVEEEVVALLAGAEHTSTVLRDQAEADEAGVTAVPGYRVADRTISGAVPVAELRALLTT